MPAQVLLAYVHNYLFNSIQFNSIQFIFSFPTEYTIKFKANIMNNINMQCEYQVNKLTKHEINIITVAITIH